MWYITYMKNKPYQIINKQKAVAQFTIDCIQWTVSSLIKVGVSRFLIRATLEEIAKETTANFWK